MTITIQLNSVEDSKIMDSLLLLFRQHNLEFKIAPQSAWKPRPKRKKPEIGLADSLHGSVRLPENFDYKTFLADSLLQKHPPRG